MDILITILINEFIEDSTVRAPAYSGIDLWLRSFDIYIIIKYIFTLKTIFLGKMSQMNVY